MLRNTGEFGQKRSATPLAWVVGVGLLIWFVANGIASGQFLQLGLTGLGLVVVLIGLKILNDWRAGFYLFVTLLLFEDLIRKYLSNNPFTFFGKEVLVGITFLSFMRAWGRGEASLFRPGFSRWLWLLVLFAVAQVFNPNSPNLFFGIMGLKVYFYYVPLMFVTYALIRTEQDLGRFLVFNCALAGIIAGLGIVQSIVGLDFLSPRQLAPELQELGHLTRYSPITRLAVDRPTSVFVSDGRFAAYILMAFIMAFGAAAYVLFRNVRGRMIVFASVGLLIVAAVMSGSRGSLVYMVVTTGIMSVGMFWGAPWRLPGAVRVLRAVKRSLWMAALALLIVAFLFPAAFASRIALYSETLLPSSPAFEAKFRVWDYPLNNFELTFNDPEWVMGHGIGTGSLSSQYVAKVLGVPNPGNDFGVENGYGMLILELGIPGVILWILWALAFSVTAARTVLKLGQTATFSLGFSAALYCCLLLFPFTWGGPAYQNYVSNAYFWMLAGLLFRLPAFEAESALARAQEESQNAEVQLQPALA